MTATPDFDAIYAGVPARSRGATTFGFAVMAVGVLGFGAWAAVAPIAGAVVAPGVFVATGQNRTVQHLEGGIVETIHVREGAVVRRGDPILTLGATAARSDLSRLELAILRLSAEEARLMAEVEGRGTLEYPGEILAASKAQEVADALEEQRRIFEARRDATRSRLDGLAHERSLLERRLEGLADEIAGLGQQVALFDEELAAKRTLLDRGLTQLSVVLSLERAAQAARTRLGRARADGAETRERIAGIETAIGGVRHDVVRTGIETLSAVRGQIDDLGEQLRQARDVLDRLVVPSPIDGVVVRLNHHTTGGVIDPGEALAEIVPLDEELVIETVVEPKDIDVVQRGQAASIRLTALNQRTTPVLAGEVLYVSADALPGGTMRQGREGDVYVARIAIHPEEKLRADGFAPKPGMPAEVQIKTADRTFLEYMLQPLRDSMARAFRED
jgi:HlyD family secretion protein